MKTLALVALGFLALSTVACAEAPTAEEDTGGSSAAITEPDAAITMENWETHPAIVAIAKEVKATKAAAYKTESKEMCPTYGERDRVKATDAKGVVRKVTLTRGNDTSATTEEYYFDAKGQLRFAMGTLFDVFDQAFQSVSYFDANGSAIWSMSRLAQGTEDAEPDLEAEAWEEALDSSFDANAQAAAMWSAPARCEE